jgi:alpha-tubulin suppressor-like RCC1 family protein
VTASGTVYTWGSNSRGQLGTGTQRDHNLTPEEVKALAGEQVTTLSAGDHHTVATTADGRGLVWGANQHGQLGNDTSTRDAREPIALGNLGALDGHTLTSISAGDDHNLALATNGQVISWGRDSNGRLGNANATGDTPRPIAAQLHTHALHFGDQQTPADQTRIDLTAGTLTAPRPDPASGWLRVTITLTGR